MPDSILNQGAGLLGLGQALGPQLIPMVSHGDDKTELPVLWQLCTTLVEMGLGVTVLDGTKTESATNPGLRDLLDYRYGYAPAQSEAPDWTILPCASGLQEICTLSGKQPANLQRIAQLFQAGSVVILYTGVEQLVKLLGAGNARPLLCVSEEKNSLLTSYLALKRLLLKGGMEPLILNMMAVSHQRGATHSGSLGNNLGECAKNFLGYEVKSINIQAAADRSVPGANMRSLVTRLLDTALDLSPTPASPYQASAGLTPGPLRSH